MAEHQHIGQNLPSPEQQAGLPLNQMEKSSQLNGEK
jgi:hypothetical protein